MSIFCSDTFSLNVKHSSTWRPHHILGIIKLNFPWIPYCPSIQLSVLPIGSWLHYLTFMHLPVSAVNQKIPSGKRQRRWSNIAYKESTLPHKVLYHTVNFERQHNKRSQVAFVWFVVTIWSLTKNHLFLLA